MSGDFDIPYLSVKAWIPHTPFTRIYISTFDMWPLLMHFISLQPGNTTVILLGNIGNITVIPGIGDNEAITGEIPLPKTDTLKHNARNVYRHDSEIISDLRLFLAIFNCRADRSDIDTLQNIFKWKIAE